VADNRPDGCGPAGLSALRLAFGLDPFRLFDFGMIDP